MTIKEQYQKMYQVANIYKDLFETELFKAFIYNLVDKPPGEVNVTGILSDTYTFYCKWINVWGDIQWSDCIKESHELSHKYNCDMCNEMLVQILDMIEKKFKGGEVSE